MNIFLSEFAKINKDQKIIMIMDGAGWHQSKKLLIPSNIRIMALLHPKFILIFC